MNDRVVEFVTWRLRDLRENEEWLESSVATMRLDLARTEADLARVQADCAAFEAALAGSPGDVPLILQ